MADIGVKGFPAAHFVFAAQVGFGISSSKMVVPDSIAGFVFNWIVPKTVFRL